MTVKELTEKLAKLDANMTITAYREDESGTDFFEISDVSVSAGTPRRFDNGKVGFTFKNDGSVKWAFISLETP